MTRTSATEGPMRSRPSRKPTNRRGLRLAVSRTIGAGWPGAILVLALAVLLPVAGCGGDKRTVLVASLTARPAAPDVRTVEIAVGDVRRSFSLPTGLDSQTPVKLGVFVDGLTGQQPVQATAPLAAGCSLVAETTAQIPSDEGAVVNVDLMLEMRCPGNDAGGRADGSSPAADARPVTPDAGAEPGGMDAATENRDVATSDRGIDLAIDRAVDLAIDRAPDVAPDLAPDVAPPVKPPSLTKCAEYDHNPAKCDPDKGFNDYAVYSVAFSPDGKLMASTADDGRVKLWTVADGKIAAEGRVIGNMNLARVAFSPDGAFLAVGADAGELFLYDLKENLRISLAGHMDRIRMVGFSKDGTRLVTMDKAKVLKVWDVAGRKAVVTLTLPAEPMSGAVAPVNRAGELWVAIGLVKTEVQDGVDAGPVMYTQGAYLWIADVNNPASAKVMKADDDQVDAVAFAPDGQILASGGESGDAILWNVADKNNIAKIVTEPRSVDNTPAMNVQGVTGLAFSPDGKYLFTVFGGWSVGGAYRIWDVAMKSVRNAAPGSAGTYYPVSAAWSPIGNAVVAGEVGCGKVLFCQD